MCTKEKYTQNVPILLCHTSYSFQSMELQIVWWHAKTISKLCITPKLRFGQELQDNNFHLKHDFGIFKRKTEHATPPNIITVLCLFETSIYIYLLFIYCIMSYIVLSHHFYLYPNFLKNTKMKNMLVPSFKI